MQYSAYRNAMESTTSANVCLLSAVSLRTLYTSDAPLSEAMRRGMRLHTMGLVLRDTGPVRKGAHQTRVLPLTIGIRWACSSGNPRGSSGNPCGSSGGVTTVTSSFLPGSSGGTTTADGITGALSS